MADDRIEQAERTPAKNQSCTGRPVESRLATVGEKWDNVDRTVLRGSLTERNLARICAQKRAFLLPARSQLQKDTLTVMATEDWPVKCRSVALCELGKCGNVAHLHYFPTDTDDP